MFVCSFLIFLLPSFFPLVWLVIIIKHQFSCLLFSYTLPSFTFSISSVCEYLKTPYFSPGVDLCVSMTWPVRVKKRKGRFTVLLPQRVSRYCAGALPSQQLQGEGASGAGRTRACADRPGATSRKNNHVNLRQST